jgi:hypothetical protein
MYPITKCSSEKEGFMATKAATPAKKPAAKKTAAPAKATANKRVSKGQAMACEVCGLAVVVEEVGGLVISEESTLLCCGKPMKGKAKTAKAAAAKPAKAAKAK